MKPRYDVVIVGGGPAGLNAALSLGRCRRSVLVIDEGRPRNRRSHALHGFITRDGSKPGRLLELARAELTRYGVELVAGRVKTARRDGTRFAIETERGKRIAARAVLVATGVLDPLPPVPGIGELYGRSVFHCPYCDGWEVRDRALAVYGKDHGGFQLALGLLTWSRDVWLLGDGPDRLSSKDRDRLTRHGVRIDTRRIARLEGKKGLLKRVVFQDGGALARDALFFKSPRAQASDLPERLGLDLDRHGEVRTNKLKGTATPGLYVAGDAAMDVQLAICAAADGARAAFAINTLLQVEDFP